MLPSMESQHQPDSSDRAPPNQFLVCGLGSLGQHCVAVLKQYGGTVRAIEVVQPKDWELPNVPDLLEELLIGDCRQPIVLVQAKIQQCRSILLVTSDERVNTEAALAARLLNPQIRLVVRSDKQNLNQLLSQNLGNFVAFEPNQLTATAFALAAFGSDTLGYFNLEGNWFWVVKYQVQPGDRWCDRFWLKELNSSTRRVLSHNRAGSQSPKQFYQWNAEAILHSGDTVVCVEVRDKLTHFAAKSATKSQYNLHQLWQDITRNLAGKNFSQKIAQLWQLSRQYQTLRVAGLCGITVLILLFCGMVLFRWNYPELSLRDALNATTVLLLGGFDNFFGHLKLPFPISWWLHLFSLGLTIAGTVFVGILYALLTEALLSSRFQFFIRRPPVPQQDHVVLVGLDRVGQQVAALLQQFQQPLVAISLKALETDVLPQIPLIVGNIANAFAKVNLAKAKSIVVVTDNDMENLEIGLMAHAASPTSGIVIRTEDRHFSDNVSRLFPYAKVLCVAALSAEAFSAAAYGENVLGLFHLDERTILVTEYSIEAGDTLNELLLAEVAYGYHVVPILHQKYTRESPRFMPSDDTRLHVGDRLVVLATTYSLQRVERGELAAKNWQVRIEKALTPDAIFNGANEITLISGCSLSLARELMKHLPQTLPTRLYQHQAQRLVAELSKARVIARLLPVDRER